MWGDMAYYILPSEKVGGTSPVSPTYCNCAHGYSHQNQNGDLLRNEDDIRDRWRKYFKVLSNLQSL